MYSKSFSLEKLASSYNIPEFVQTACSYECRLKIQNNQGTFDPKSIMGMMSFNPKDGVLTVVGEGKDEEMAVNALFSLLSSKHAL